MVVMAGTFEKFSGVAVQAAGQAQTTVGGGLAAVEQVDATGEIRSLLGIKVEFSEAFEDLPLAFPVAEAVGGVGGGLQ